MFTYIHLYACMYVRESLLCHILCTCAGHTVCASGQNAYENFQIHMRLIVRVRPPILKGEYRSFGFGLFYN